ncbi:MAG TPA: amidohydrolase family protein, partial [Xanthomonadales bacterium]|nr:amidohydrolase family protein [Xanthomonadales bacterium]
TMIASDGGIFTPGPNVPHPRNYGTFARVLAEYVRQRHVLEFSEAIHKMTRMPADRIGLTQRGRIEHGAFADIAVFDPAQVADTATFENPHQYALGMRHVFINGQAVLLDGRMTGVRPGKVLRHATAPDQQPAPVPVLPRRVLLVGNSFSFYNNGLHTHLRKLLSSSNLPGKEKFAQKMMTISGARLEDHRAGLESILMSFKPDTVVLQGHSMEPIEPGEAAGFQNAVKEFAAIIREHGASPVLLMTWAYTGKPEMTEALANAYESAGVENNIAVLPAGRAFARAELEIPSLRLRVDDLKHPTLEGSYLAATVLYSGLYRQSPEDLSYTAGLPAELAMRLRAIAWSSVELEEIR